MALDADFSVGFRHRLRFTRAALDTRNPALRDVIASADGRPARGLAFIDDGAAAAQPQLPLRLDAYARAHADRIGLAGPPVLLPGGESVKNERAHLDGVIRAIHDARLCRQSYVIVVGGGAVLDLVGFAAATAHRGIRLIRLPSTTLSQADSGIGVKNGVNAFGKKNYLGTFSPPWAVINDTDLLRTLSDRDWRCGFSEAVKVGLIKDAAFFDMLCRSAADIRLRKPEAALPVIRRSAELHLEHIVSCGDPFELTHARPLDFGHWAAHKLEQMTCFGMRHGEAVAIGIALDATYSALQGHLEPATAERILACLCGLGFDLYHDALEDTETLLAGLDEFREHLGGPLTITLLRDAGQPIEADHVERADMLAAIERLAARPAAGQGDPHHGRA